MLLTRHILDSLKSDAVLPHPHLFQLPEKVLQFGTGVLLRALPDYFIDKANRNNIFNGRIVVVKSTPGSTEGFKQQDNLYTLGIRGIDNNETRDNYIINASISRVLSATSEWEEILSCASNPKMQIIISNTTELGIELVPEAISHHHSPVSFPGKLLAFLRERYTVFAGSKESGMVIIPTELVPDNGSKLEAIVLELAHLNGFDTDFIDWIEQSNTFCSSLVDRIVPGRPALATKQELNARLGYEDEQMVMAEPYRLWAIEGNEQVRQVLSFAEADKQVIIQPDIEMFRELKLRLLNGTHTLSCGLAHLSGYSSVDEAMKSGLMSEYIANVMEQEIGSAIPYKIAQDKVQEFCCSVLDRFSNPFIQHSWLSITTQYSSKMKQRVIPLLLEHYRHRAEPPELISLGFAGFLLFMKPVYKKGDVYYGAYHGREYIINDLQAPLFYEIWNSTTTSQTVEKVLSDTGLWDTDLCRLAGFADAVHAKLEFLLKEGVEKALAARRCA